MIIRVVLLATALAAASVEAGPEVQVAGDVGSRLDRWLVTSKFQGSVLVSNDGAVLLRKGYGLADRENRVAYTPDTVFSIGSITKQFTAAAILKLEMQGKLRVENTITKFFPQSPEDKRSITLHQLLTHTSGLASDFAGDYDPVGRDDYVAKVLSSKLRTQPGTTYFYSNAGYSLLAAVIEIASGKPYERYLSESLLLPAGMRDTGYRLPGWEPSRISVGYREGERWGRITEKPWAPDGPYWALRGNGGIHSTLDDLLRWHRALSGDQVLSRAEKGKMYARHAREKSQDSFYGYGWAVSDLPGVGRLVEHNGGNAVFFADFLRFLDEDLVVILSTNDSEVKGGRTSHALARLALGEDVPPPAPEGTPAQPLAAGGRDAVIRAWFDAFNAPGHEAMRAFRAANARPRPEIADAERDRRLDAMREDLGRLDAEGVVARSDDEITVRARSARGPVALLRFLFLADGKLDSIGVEVGD